MAGRAIAILRKTAAGISLAFGLILASGAASAGVYPEEPVQSSETPWETRAPEIEVQAAVRALDRIPARASRAVTQPKAATPAKAVATITAPLVVPKPKAVAPAPASAHPRVAVVIDDLGLNARRVQRLIELDGPLTLAFLPYGYDLPHHSREARSRGHEVFLHLPMEPIGRENPGPNALLENLGPAEFERRLIWAFEQVEGIRGFNNHMGSRLTANPLAMQRVMAEARKRNLLFLDSRTSGRSVAYATAVSFGVAAETRDIFLDHDPSEENVARQFAKAESIARRKGHAIVIGHPYDSTYTVLKDWIGDARARGIEIVPVSVLIEQAGVPAMAAAGGIAGGSHGAGHNSAERATP